MIDPQITKNFHLKEWKTHDGTGVPWDLIDNVTKCAKNLQALRDEIGKPITIISGFRNLTYNTKIGSKPTSQHVKGTAADIKVRGMSPQDVANAIEELIKQGKMDQGGVGVYKSFTHYDCRGTRARWRG